MIYIIYTRRLYFKIAWEQRFHEYIDLEIKDIVAIHHSILAIHIGGMVACDDNNDIQYITNSNIT